MSEFPNGCSVLFGAGALGLASAQRMGELGAHQVLTYRKNSAPAAELAARLEADGLKCAVMQCDVTDPASVRQVFEQAVRLHERVHTVINATGLQYSFKPIADQSRQAFREVLRTDVEGFFNILQVAVPHMRGNKGGSIVTIGTAAVAATTPGNTLSSVPKSAVAMMVRLVAAEEGPSGIRANFVGAGAYAAGMALRMQERSQNGFDSLQAFAEQFTPLRRPGQASECADVVAFLASSRASYVTGQILHVDGGLSV